MNEDSSMVLLIAIFFFLKGKGVSPRNAFSFFSALAAPSGLSCPYENQDKRPNLSIS
jgi:hypothetical protein